MKKEKKKRETNKFNGEPSVEPITIDVLDEPHELTMVFSFSNRGLKMLKAGKKFEQTFLKDGKQCTMHFMHRDIYDDGYKKQLDIRRRLIVEAKKKEGTAE